MKTADIYVALLRGINVGGKNQVKMSDLKNQFEKLGYNQVQTYINSGNVIFTAQESQDQIEAKLEQSLQARFGFQIRVMVRGLEEINDLVAILPDSWQTDSKRKHDVIFLSRTIDQPNLVENLHPNHDIEELGYHSGVLLWSVDIEAYSRSNVAKIAGTKLRQEMTVRNPRTVQKIYQLMRIIKP